VPEMVSSLNSSTSSIGGRRYWSFAVSYDITFEFTTSREVRRTGVRGLESSASRVLESYTLVL